TWQRSGCGTWDREGIPASGRYDVLACQKLHGFRLIPEGVPAASRGSGPYWNRYSVCRFYAVEAISLARVSTIARAAVTRPLPGATGSLRPLGTVFRAPLAAVGNTGRVQGAPHRVVTHPEQVLDPAAADEHHRVLLQVVALAADAGRH